MNTIWVIFTDKSFLLDIINNYPNTSIGDDMYQLTNSKYNVILSATQNDAVTFAMHFENTYHKLNNVSHVFLLGTGFTSNSNIDWGFGLGSKEPEHFNYFIT